MVEVQETLARKMHIWSGPVWGTVLWPPEVIPQNPYIVCISGAQTFPTYSISMERKNKSATHPSKHKISLCAQGWGFLKWHSEI